MFNGTTVGLGPCVGAVFDGRFLYFVPFGHGRVVRFDTTGDFEDREAWSAMDAAAAHEFEPAGWKGGFFDGRFVYFTPFRGEVSVGSSRSPFHGNVLRYDSAGSFEDADNWAVRDAGFTDWLHTTAFTAGVSDGRYLYAAPWRGDLDDGGSTGGFCDTIGNRGGFSLRACEYGHNGGLGGAVGGPSFIVNTDAGPFTARAKRALDTGWHHLAGVYDGGSVTLYVDGAIAASGPARGRLLGQEEDIAMGPIADGSARFWGEIGETCISASARKEEWVRTRYEEFVAQS